MDCIIYPVGQDFRQWLTEEFRFRKKKNPAYTLRTFSMKLGLSAGSLCEILTGKRPITTKAALKIMNRFGLPDDQISALLGSFHTACSNQSQEETREDFVPLTSDTFNLISCWYHYAILSLVETKDFVLSAQWIAHRLVISPIEAHDALMILEKMGLVRKENGRIFRNSNPPSFISTVFVNSLQKFHEQTINKAAESLAHSPIEEKDFSSITMAIDPDHLPKAVEAIKRFRRQMCKMLETGNKRRVYTLAVQLFPLDVHERQPASKSA